MAFRVTRYLSTEFVPNPDQLVGNWVHRDVCDVSERQRQARLLATLLLAGMFLASVLPLTLFVHAGLHPITVLLLTLSAGTLALAGVLMQSGRRAVVEMFACVLAATGLTVTCLFTGGITSPFLALALLLPFEAFRIGRNRRSLVAGSSLMAIIVLGVFAVGTIQPANMSLTSQGVTIATMSVLALLGLYGFITGATAIASSPDEKTAPKLDLGQYEHLFDCLPGLVSVHNERGHCLAAHGAGARQLIGAIGSVKERGLIENMHISDRLIFLQAIDRMRTGVDSQDLKVRMRRKAPMHMDDQLLHLTMHLTAQRVDGEFSGFVAQSRDISSEVALQQAYALKVDEAESANETKTRFLAAVSHELRTPLNAILGFSDLLSGEYLGKPLDDKQREYVGLIHQSGRHLLDVINSMLDLSKIEAGRYELNPETFDVRDAVDGCEAMLAPQAKDKNLTLTARVAKGDTQMVACRRAVHQILINLLANAIKFTEDEGVVTVDTIRSGDMMCISVSDTGIGIEADDIDRIGAPFVQVENRLARQFEGSGLGLSLVKGLVALHSGVFSIESKPGSGTTVTVKLPIDGPEPAVKGMDTQLHSAIEFPPRLKHATQSGKESSYDQAKTA